MDPELIVRFKGDTRDFEAAINRITASLNNLQPAINNATNAANNFSGAGNNLNNSFRNLLKGYVSVQAVIQGGKMFIDATKQVQKYENQLKVASGTQEDYAKNTAFLEGLADKYNKNVIELGASYAKLTIATRGTNMEGEKTDRLFAAVTATSSALQMSVDETNGTFQAFIQMVSKGNVQAEELRGQLGERLYGAFNLAAKSMGVTTSELNKMLERGEVLASDLLPKMTVQMEKAYGEVAQANARNLGSSIDYATGQVTLFVAELGKTSGITDTLQSIARGFGDIVKKARELNEITPNKRSVLDMMFTLPGNNTGGISTIESFAKLIYAYRNPTGSEPVPTISERRERRSKLDSSAPADEVNTAANEKAKKAAEIAAKKAEAAINKWVSDQIRDSKDRIASGLLDAQIANDTAFRTNNSDIKTPGAKLPTGLTNNYTYSGQKTGQSFTNGVTGDGSASNYNNIIAGMDAAIEQIKIKAAKMKGVIDTFGYQLNEGIKNSLGGAVIGVTEAMGGIAAGLATGTLSLGDVGNAFLGIIADLFQNIGQALSTFAATKLLADIAFSSMSAPAALAGAALAFGAAALARSQMQESGQNAFYTGGIISGRGGVDNVPIMASPGEMVVNGSQQNRLWGLISGAYSGREFSSAGGRSSSGEDVNVNVFGRLKGSDIDLSGSAGKRKNNYFSGKRG